MAPLKSLPDGQRLVLHLLLEDGRSYAEIAELLSIDRAAVRARTLAAFDTGGPPIRHPLRATGADRRLSRRSAAPPRRRGDQGPRERVSKRACVGGRGQKRARPSTESRDNCPPQPRLDETSYEPTGTAHAGG